MECYVINPESDAYRVIRAISEANVGGGRVSIDLENEINTALGTFACNHWSGKKQVYAGFPTGRLYEPLEGVTKIAAEDDDLDIPAGWY